MEVLIANYHSPQDDATSDVIRTLQKFGVENIKLQREVFNPELYFKLMAIASIGDLKRMTQYKSTKDQTAHLMTYPVLMAHDVAGYEEVMVGADQTQHLEYARRLLRRYNRTHKQNLRLPKTNVVGFKVMDLR